jgi:hypothetical protein
LDLGLLSWGKGATAALELAQGQSGGLFSAAFSPCCLLPFPEPFAAPLAKDLLVDGAAGEVVDGEATDGADVGEGASAEACHQDRGDQGVDFGGHSGAAGLLAHGVGAELLFWQQQQAEGPLQRRSVRRQAIGGQLDPDDPLAQEKTGSPAIWASRIKAGLCTRSAAGGRNRPSSRTSSSLIGGAVKL